MPDQLPFSPACERNKQPIFQAIKHYLKSGDSILEIGSGTGQHAEYMCQQRPDITWQLSDQAHYLDGLRLRCAPHQLQNVLDPIELDVDRHDWANQQYDIIYSANTLHIMSQASAEHFLSHAHSSLKPNGILILYGPFIYANEPLSDSNKAFDRRLRHADPDQGLRHFDDLSSWLVPHFTCLDDIAMPANNRCLIWQQRR